MKDFKYNSDNWAVIVSIVLVILTAIFALFYLVQKNQQTLSLTDKIDTTQKTCVSDECLSVDNLEYPAGELPIDISKAIKSAIDDEYKAYSTYNAVITRIGSVRPFSMIIRAEESHIASLKALLDKYGETVPPNPYVNNVEVKSTLAENCQIGVDAEIANIALYRDELIPVVSAYPDIRSVFEKLMNASEDKHLPAFEKCN